MVGNGSLFKVVTYSDKCPELRGKTCKASEKMFSKLKDVLEEIEELEGVPSLVMKYFSNVCRVWIYQL